MKSQSNYGPSPHGQEMPVVQYPFKNCGFQMPDLDSVVAAALITAHTIIHASPHSIVPVEKPEEVKRPCISHSGLTEN